MNSISDGENEERGLVPVQRREVETVDVNLAIFKDKKDARALARKLGIPYSELSNARRYAARGYAVEQFGAIKVATGIFFHAAGVAQAALDDLAGTLETVKQEAGTETEPGTLPISEEIITIHKLRKSFLDSLNSSAEGIADAQKAKAAVDTAARPPMPSFPPGTLVSAKPTGGEQVTIVVSSSKPSVASSEA
jgi:hypothetical protein